MKTFNDKKDYTEIQTKNRYVKHCKCNTKIKFKYVLSNNTTYEFIL